MLLEGLVVFSCINQTGCEESTKGYFYYNPTVLQMVEKNEQEVRKYVNPYILEYLLPVMGAFVNNAEFSLKVNKHLTFVSKSDTIKVIINKEF